MTVGKSPYQHLPSGSSEWGLLIEPAKDVYWQARRDNKTETESLLFALNELMGGLARHGHL